MSLSKLFLTYYTVWFPILLTSHFCHIYEVLGRKSIYIDTGYISEIVTDDLMYVILFSAYKPMR